MALERTDRGRACRGLSRRWARVWGGRTPRSLHGNRMLFVFTRVTGAILAAMKRRPLNLKRLKSLTEAFTEDAVVVVSAGWEKALLVYLYQQ